MSATAVQPPWTEEEDAALLAALDEPRGYGSGRRQAVILREVGQQLGRSGNACLHRLKRLRQEAGEGVGTRAPKQWLSDEEIAALYKRKVYRNFTRADVERVAGYLARGRAAA